MAVGRLATRIFLGLTLGIVFGALMRLPHLSPDVKAFVVQNILDLGGIIFVSIVKMLVVPVVFTSLVCGLSALKDVHQLGRLGIKTFSLYLITTAVAITLALLIANLFPIGHSQVTPTGFQGVNIASAPPLKSLLIDLVPHNPIRALAEGEMLQIIVFALLLGIAITRSEAAGEKLMHLFDAASTVLTRLVMMVINFAPYGVFCLLGKLVATQGFDLIFIELFEYFVMVLSVLLLHMLLTYSTLLVLLTNINPVLFFKRMYLTMLFAFSVSSSSVTIPVVMRTVQSELGVGQTVASFVIPLGATINMDGTAIMQGVATVFIANAYHISIGIEGFLIIILMATLASVGTAGVPGIGLITLTMVLQHLGIPVEGIGMIIGVDRILDMVRTAVNITGDAVIACVVAKSERVLRLPS